ncbi:MAG: DUF72 domain-containing protein [Chitinophagaceae bacterium]|nr:DUF72 domain-containing protein [Chitinophagaceae bacterium]
MEFGRVEEKALKQIDLSLPVEPVFNKKVLRGKAYKKPTVYVGCAKWGRKEWVGKLYPPKTRERDFLSHYVRHYNSIELNATHYKIYGAAGISKWCAIVGDQQFLFCPKMYKGVSHRGKLDPKSFIAKEFFRGVAAFKEHLGPILVQVHERFSPKRKEELYGFLSGLPAGFQYFLEVRHPDWFEPETQQELFKTLSKLKVGSVITDTAGRRDAAHMHLSIPAAFIRFVGNSLHPTDFPRIDEWVERINYWLKSGIRTVYFFMHMHDEATSPELSADFVKKLNAACQLDLPVPQLINALPVKPKRSRKK